MGPGGDPILLAAERVMVRCFGTRARHHSGWPAGSGLRPQPCRTSYLQVVCLPADARGVCRAVPVWPVWAGGH